MIKGTIFSDTTIRIPEAYLDRVFGSTWVNITNVGCRSVGFEARDEALLTCAESDNIEFTVCPELNGKAVDIHPRRARRVPRLVHDTEDIPF